MDAGILRYAPRSDADNTSAGQFIWIPLQLQDHVQSNAGAGGTRLIAPSPEDRREEPSPPIPYPPAFPVNTSLPPGRRLQPGQSTDNLPTENLLEDTEVLLRRVLRRGDEATHQRPLDVVACCPLLLLTLRRALF